MTDVFDPRTAITILLDRAAPEVAGARYELDSRARGRIELIENFSHFRKSWQSLESAAKESPEAQLIRAKWPACGALIEVMS